jgi:hypothetical protein
MLIMLISEAAGERPEEVATSGFPGEVGSSCSRCAVYKFVPRRSSSKKSRMLELGKGRGGESIVSRLLLEGRDDDVDDGGDEQRYWLLVADQIMTRMKR